MNHDDTDDKTCVGISGMCMTSFYLRPEEDKCILVKIATRFFSPFLAGIEEPFTKTGVCGWQQEVTQTVPFRSGGGNGVHI